jgi:anoctamin-10
MSALSNSALVYMFEPRVTSEHSTLGGQRVGTMLDATTANANATTAESLKAASGFNYRSILLPALMIALSSSHAYILVRLVIRHLIRRAVWKGSKEERQAREADVEIKRLYIRSLVSSTESGQGQTLASEKTPDAAFWERDDGESELHAITKDM